MHLFALVIPVAAATLLGHHEAGSVYSMEKYGVLNRLTQAAYGSVFYVWKTLLPLKLSALYQVNYVPQPWDMPFLPACAAFLAATGLAAWLALRGRPAALLAWGAYLLLLAPVSGLAQTGYQLAADRYSYFATLPLLLLAGGLLPAGRRGLLLLLPAAALMAGLYGLTYRQLLTWKDSETLWRQAKTVEPDAAYTLDNLGDALADKGKLEEAIENYERCIIVNPGFAECQNDLSTAYFEKGQVRRAIRHLGFALARKPDYALAHHNLANIYFFVTGRPDLAVRHYAKAAAYEPGNAAYRSAYGRALYVRGRHREALKNFEEALRLDPRDKTAAYGRKLSLEALRALKAG